MASTSEDHNVCVAYNTLATCTALDKPHLKQLLPHMRAGCPAVGEASHNECLRLLCNFLSSSVSKSRQVALSLLQASQTSREALSAAVSDSLLTGVERSVPDNVSACQSLLNFAYALFENFPSGLDCVSTHFHTLIRWISKCLQHHAQVVRCSEGLESLSTSVNKELSQGLLGLAVLCVQRLKKLHGHLIALMTACSTANDQTSSAEPIASGSAQIDVSYFKDLLVTSISILMDDAHCVETMTSAAVLATLILRFANGLNTIPSGVEHSLSTSNILHQISSVLGKAISPSTCDAWPVYARAWSDLLFSKLSVSGRRALLHAIVSSLPRTVLFANTDALCQFADAGSHSSGSAGSTVYTCLLLDWVLPSVYELCKSSDNSNLRVLSFRLLANVAHEMKSAASSTADLTYDLLVHLRQRLLWSGSVVQQMIDFICDNWDDPVDAVRHQINSTFECLVLMHVTVHKDDVAQSQSLIRPTLHTLLNLSWHIRGKYLLLASFAQHTDVVFILELCPTLPDDLLAVIKDLKLHSPASDLFNKLCGCHYEQLQKHQQQQQSSEEHTTLLVEAWQRTWLDPLLHWLCTGGSRVRTHLTEFCLPVLFRNTPNSLAYLSTSLSAALHKQGDNAGILSALLLCLHHIRTGSTRQKMASNQHRNPSSTTSKTTTGDMCQWSDYAGILKQALAHSDDEVRLNALALLCESRQTSEPLSVEDIDLMQFFLPYNLSSQDPSFRQRLETSMKKVLLRMHASLHVAVRESDRLRKQASMAASPSERDTAKRRDQLEKYQSYLDMCVGFLTWLVELLISCIEPVACFQRRTAALRLLHVIVDAFPSPVASFSTTAILSQPHVVQNLINNVLNESYSSNQELLVTLLVVALPSNSLGFQNAVYRDSYIQCMCWLASSPRAEDCTTSQYLLQIIIKNFVECCQAELELSVELFSCPLASGQSASAPVLTIPQEQLESSTGTVDAQNRVRSISGAAQIPLHGRMLKLWQQYLSCINHRLAIAQSQGLLASFSQCSLYGLVMSLRSMLSQPSVAKLIQQLSADQSQSGQAAEFLRDCIKMCIQLACVVQPVVCNDTPEGYCVDEVSDAGLSANPDLAAKDFQSQLVVVCSWRCLKESALLLAHLLQVCSVPNVMCKTQLDLVLLSAAQVQEVGAFFVKQLISSRHLGAFEQVHNGFVILCQHLWRCSDPSLNQLPLEWVRSLLDDLRASLSCSDSALSVTRRSAGLPRYVQAILITQPSSQNFSCLKLVVQELMHLVSQPVEAGETVDTALSQVHAINIMCALFREAKLGPHILPFVADALILAIQGFAHSVWAIRNSSTLLFRALIGRIFGVNTARPGQPKTNRLTGREFFARYPDLYSRLLQLLTEAVQSDMHSPHSDAANTCGSMLEPRLFPLLLLLSHLIPSVSSFSLQSFTPLVMRCCGVRVWQARVMAAESLVPLVSVDELYSVMQMLVSSLPTTATGTATVQNEQKISYNTLHGTLLQLFHLVKYHIDQCPSSAALSAIHRLLPLIWERRWLVTSENACSLVRSLAVQLFAKCCCTLTSEVADDNVLSAQHRIRQYVCTVAEQYALDASPLPRAERAGESTNGTDTDTHHPGRAAEHMADHQVSTSLARVLLDRQGEQMSCLSGETSENGGKEPAAGKKQDVMNALLHSPCYETQLATLDYYSSVCAMFTRKNAISCGSGGGDDSCRGAGRNDDEEGTLVKADHYESSPALILQPSKQLLNCLSAVMELFLDENLHPLCIQKTADVLSQCCSLLLDRMEGKSGMTCDMLKMLLVRCCNLLKRGHQNWECFGHVFLFMSTLLRSSNALAVEDDMWTTLSFQKTSTCAYGSTSSDTLWLDSLKQASDLALSWQLRMLAAQSIGQVFQSCVLPSQVKLSAWIHAVQLLQDEQMDVRSCMSHVVMQACVQHGLVRAYCHLHVTRTLALALVAMTALCSLDSYDVTMATLQAWSHSTICNTSPTATATTSVTQADGQLFLKSELNSYFEASWLAGETSKVLTFFFPDDREIQVSPYHDLDQHAAAAAYISQHILPVSHKLPT
ncbi:tRNA (32-2'-O)-methyltransferase regulator THADA-like isoform X1 [Sycon ciliatum]|uniref:tRNA (32-2'-O)-methyltransferase regulator THADA-like isoform X1 n=1 Tax=Sycon ciliatum TaxID=27933 RepID=UPI0031F6F11F